MLLFLGGLSYYKDILLYVYLLEIVPERYRVYVSSYKISLNTVVSHIHLSLYFYYGGKNWKYGFGVSAITIVLSFCMTFCMPESPKYLYSKRDWSKLHQTMISIARINGTNTFKTKKAIQHEDTINDLQDIDDQIIRTEEYANQNEDFKHEEYSVLNALRERTVFVNLVAVII